MKTATLMMTALCATALCADVTPAPVINPISAVPATAETTAPAPVVAPASAIEPAPQVSSVNTSAVLAEDYLPNARCYLYMVNNASRHSINIRSTKELSAILDGIDDGTREYIKKVFDGQKHFAVRDFGDAYDTMMWSGFVKVAKSGTYTFIMKTEQPRGRAFHSGMALRVNDKQEMSLDNQATLKVDLKAGYNKISVLFVPWGKSKQMSLGYKLSDADGDYTPISPAELYHAAE